MTSIVNIYNLALGNLGVQQTVSSDTEKSNEARACNRFYDSARDYVLRRFPWPFATAYQALALVGENPNTDWKYSYRYPSQCLSIRRIVNPLGRKDIGRVFNDGPLAPISAGYGMDPGKIPYTLSNDSGGKLIFTDMENASVEFTARVVDTVLFDPLFVDALSWHLAVKIGPSLAGGDPFKMVKRAEAMFEMAIGYAKAAALNEIGEDVPPEAESIRARR